MARQDTYDDAANLTGAILTGRDAVGTKEFPIALFTPAALGAAATSHTQAASTISDSTAAGQAMLTAADAAAQLAAIGAAPAEHGHVVGDIADAGSLAGADFSDLSQSGSGAPSVSARWLGDTYRNTANDDIYRAIDVGAGAADWALETLLDGAADDFLTLDGSDNLVPVAALAARTKLSTNSYWLEFAFDGGGSAIEVDAKAQVVAPLAGTIAEWRIVGDQSGAVVIDIWKIAIASAPPADGNSITASALPTISASAVQASSSTLTGWTTSVSAFDVLVANIDSLTSFERLTLLVRVDRT